MYITWSMFVGVEDSLIKSSRINVVGGGPRLPLMTGDSIMTNGLSNDQVSNIMFIDI